VSSRGREKQRGTQLSVYVEIDMIGMQGRGRGRKGDHVAMEGYGLYTSVSWRTPDLSEDFALAKWVYRSLLRGQRQEGKGKGDRSVVGVSIVR
jgi:hypothetical protein